MKKSIFISPDCCLRRLDVKDALKMCALERICFSTPWSEQQCASALRQKAFKALGAFKKEILAGYISFYLVESELEILNLAVLPGQRRQGIGEGLLEIVLQYASKLAILKVILEVRESNYQAINLYQKCGFVQCGMRPRYYPDNGENALIYAKNI